MEVMKKDTVSLIANAKEFFAAPNYISASEDGRYCVHIKFYHLIKDVAVRLVETERELKVIKARLDEMKTRKCV